MPRLASQRGQGAAITSRTAIKARRGIWAALAGALGALYRDLWLPTAGRPWTYVIRQWTEDHKTQAAVVLPLLIGGALALQLEMRHWWVMLFVDFLALLAGHLWWDTLGPHVVITRMLRRRR